MRRDFEFDALQGWQGGKHFWLITLSSEQVQEIWEEFLDRKKNNALEAIQRTLNKGRLRRLIKYIEKGLLALGGFYVLPPITIAADASQFDFVAISGKAGTLKLKDAFLHLSDGQHRCGAFLNALRLYPALLKKEEVGAMIVADPGGELRSLIFLDLNQFPSKPSKSTTTAFDQRDPIAVMTMAVITEVRYFAGFVHFEANQIAKSDKEHLFALNAIREANSILLKDLPEEYGQAFATVFWNTVGDTIKHWKDAVSSNDLPAVRANTVCFHAISLCAIAKLGNHAILNGNDWKKVIQKLNAFNWRISSELEGIITFNGKIVKNQETISRFCDFLRGS